MAFSESTPHPHPIGWFQSQRSHIHTFCNTVFREIQRGMNHILIKAQVKSGKKDIVECIAQLGAPQTKVFYVTALDRKDVKKQKEELASYGVETFLVNSDAAVRQVISAINAQKARHFRIILCLDECDYGSGETQKLSGMFSEILNDEDVTKIYFSATAHETEVSDLHDRPDFRILTFTPPPNYFGAEWFLDEGLVHDADTFFAEDEDGDIVLTEHAKLVILESMIDDRHIGVVRINNDFRMKDFKKRTTKNDLVRQLREALPEGKPWEIIPVDATDSHDWEDRKTRNMYVNDSEVNYLFILKQTCTRGTDLKGWHHKLAFWHDARSHNGTSRPNTLIQAFFRPSHYSSSYGGEPQRIRLYVDYVVAELAAYDDMEAYMEAGGKPPSRTKRCHTKLIVEMSPQSFPSQDEARAWARARGRNTSAYTIDNNNGVQQIIYRGVPRNLMTEEETRAQADWRGGVSSNTARLMPCLSGDGIRWIVVHAAGWDRPDDVIQSTKSMYSM